MSIPMTCGTLNTHLESFMIKKKTHVTFSTSIMLFYGKMEPTNNISQNQSKL